MWDESKHPRDKYGKFTTAYYVKMSTDELKRLCSIYDSDAPPYNSRQLLPISYKLPDEQLPRGVGAKWANYDISMPDGSIAHFVDGSKLQNKEVFAGRGCRTQIRDRFALSRDYPGSKPELWQKVKAKAEIRLENGEVLAAEIHWYEEPTIGKVRLKYKKSL